MERASTIAKVVTASVGEMNYALAQTDVGRQRQLAAAFADIKTQFGAAFNQIAILFLPVLRAVASWLATIANLARQVAQLIAQAFGGKQIQQTANAQQNVAATAADASKATADLGNSVDKTAKKANKSNASFDQLNQLNQSIADSADNAGSALDDMDLGAGAGDLFDGGIQADVDTSGLEKALKIIQDKFQEFKDWLDKNFLGALQKPWEEAQKAIQNFKNFLQNVWNDIKSLGDPLKDWFKTDGIKLLQTYIDTMLTVLTGFLDTITKVFQDIWDNVLFVWFRKFIEEGLPEITNFIIQALDDFKNFFLGIKEWFDKLWNESIVPFLAQIAELGIKIVTSLWNTFKGIYDTVKKVIDDVVTLVLEPFIEFLTKTMLKQILAFVDGVVDDWNDFFSRTKEWFDRIWAEGVEPLLTKLEKLAEQIAQSLWDTFTGLYDSATKVINDLMDTVIKPVFETLITVILPMAVEFVSEVVKTWDTLFNSTKEIFDKIWTEGIKPALAEIVRIWDDAWTTVKGAWDKWENRFLKL